MRTKEELPRSVSSPQTSSVLLFYPKYNSLALCVGLPSVHDANGKDGHCSLPSAPVVASGGLNWEELIPGVFAEHGACASAGL